MFTEALFFFGKFLKGGLNFFIAVLSKRIKAGIAKTAMHYRCERERI